MYVGRNSRGAALLNFHDVQWGNYKHPLPQQCTPTQRQAAVDGHRRDLLADPEGMQRVRHQLRGRRLGCWCAPEPCHGHTLAWIANCDDSVFAQLLREAQDTMRCEACDDEPAVPGLLPLQHVEGPRLRAPPQRDPSTAARHIQHHLQPNSNRRGRGVRKPRHRSTR